MHPPFWLHINLMLKLNDMKVDWHHAPPIPYKPIRFSHRVESKNAFIRGNGITKSKHCGIILLQSQFFILQIFLMNFFNFLIYWSLTQYLRSHLIINVKKITFLKVCMFSCCMFKMIKDNKTKMCSLFHDSFYFIVNHNFASCIIHIISY